MLRFCFANRQKSSQRDDGQDNHGHCPWGLAHLVFRNTHQQDTYDEYCSYLLHSMQFLVKVRRERVKLRAL